MNKDTFSLRAAPLRAATGCIGLLRASSFFLLLLLGPSAHASGNVVVESYVTECEREPWNHEKAVKNCGSALEKIAMQPDTNAAGGKELVGRAARGYLEAIEAGAHQGSEIQEVQGMMGTPAAYFKQLLLGCWQSGQQAFPNAESELSKDHADLVDVAMSAERKFGKCEIQGGDSLTVAYVLSGVLFVLQGLFFFKRRQVVTPRRSTH